MTNARGRLRESPLAAVTVALVLSIAAFGGAAHAGTNRPATGTYSDPTGDSGPAPDISGVTIASAPNGQIVFRIAANFASVPDGWAVLLLDTDLNEATGSPNAFGADFFFVVDEIDRSYWFGRWLGSDWEETPYSTVSVSLSSSGVTISVNRSELGNTNELTFWARTGASEIEDGRYDDAPDDGTWNYSLGAGGPNIEAVLVSTKPSSGPKAGKPFTVTPAGLRVETTGAPPILPQPESYTCRTTLAGKTLAGTGVGRCTWRLPANARRKQLKVVVTVRYQGATRSFPFAYRVS